MAVKNRFSVYDFAEMVEVETSGTTAVDVLSIPQYTLIEKVLVRIKTAATSGSAVNLTVGDDDDADGFIVASDAKANAGTVYGDAVAELGAYLKESVSDDGNNSHDQPIPGGKLYAAAGKEVKVVLSAAPTTEAVLQVFIFGKRFNV